ncbi:radical SAM protein [candidate division KSB1 bacterium]|nr:radical SAM protein [candidate division KSB1 bacterium]
MLLIYPPISKPCEPPAGIARLAGALQLYKVPYRLIDANINAVRYILHKTNPKQGEKLFQELQNPAFYKNPDQYRNSVMKINKKLDHYSRPYNAVLSLKNLRHQQLRPVRKQDLIQAFETPELNPFYDYFKNDLLPQLKAYSDRDIAISLIYLSQALTAFSLIGLIKKEIADCRIIVGGGLMSTWMSHPNWDHPFKNIIDITVSGPGEAALLSLYHKTISKKPFYKPDYSQLFDNNYLAPGRILPYAASAGCYWRKCTFCPEKAEENRFLPVPHDQTLQTLRSFEPAGLVHFLDNAISPALLRRIAQHPLNNAWYGYVRLDRLLLDPDFCVALKKSGCVMLQLGLESGDQKVLDQMQKGIELKNASRILHNLRRAGIAIYCYLLFGTPYESYESAQKTMAFVADHADCIDFVNPAIFNLPIFSKMAQTLTTEPFYSGDLSLYVNFEHPFEWHRGKVRQFLSKEFRKHPGIAPIMQRVPPVFTSGHAPFFVMKP